MLGIFARPKTWHRYCAGKLSERTQAFGILTRVADEPPRDWELVTRDLFADFGPMMITGISFLALEGPGHAYFDHLYLGRTIEDLDRVTAAKKRVTPPPVEPPIKTSADRSDGWLLWILALAIAALALFGGWLAWRRRSKSKAAATAEAKTAEHGDGVSTDGAGMIELVCAACGKHLKVKEALAGKRVKCPVCGQAVAVASGEGK